MKIYCEIIVPVLEKKNNIFILHVTKCTNFTENMLNWYIFNENKTKNL